MDLISTYSGLLKHFSFADILMIEDKEQGAHTAWKVSKYWVFSGTWFPVFEHLSRSVSEWSPWLFLSKSGLKQLLWESLTDKFHYLQ